MNLITLKKFLVLSICSHILPHSFHLLPLFLECKMSLRRFLGSCDQKHPKTGAVSFDSSHPNGCEVVTHCVVNVFIMCLAVCLENEMATHSSILAWRIPWTGGCQAPLSMGSQEMDTT